jgi:hypothetical protein
MSQVRGVGAVPLLGGGDQPLGAVLRYVRRRYAPAHSAPPGPQRLRAGSVHGNCRRSADREF